VLDDCYWREGKIDMTGHCQETLGVGRVYLGLSADDASPIKLTKLSFTVDCANEWYGVGGINAYYDYDTRRSSVYYSAPDKLKIRSSADFEIHIEPLCSIPIGKNKFDAHITQKTQFLIVSDKEKCISIFLDIAHKIALFLCFCLNKKLSIREVYSCISSPPGQKNKRVIILYQSSLFSEEIPKLDKHDAIVTLSDIKENIQDTLCAWLDINEKIGISIYLYFLSTYTSQDNLQTCFLLMTQAIESYHRLTTNDTIMTKSDYDTIVAYLMRYCPPARKKWLKQKLHYGNELLLRESLTSLFKRYPFAFNSQYDVKKFTSKIVATRNYYTHFSLNLEKEAADGRELWKLTQKMEAIFELIILRSIGFDENTVGQIARKRPPLQQKLQDS
jgi:hypothetical protein